MSSTEPGSFKTSLKMLMALGSPIRLRAMHEIYQHGPTTALPLGTRLGIDVKKMSRHLQCLRKAGLVEQGMGRVYKLPDRATAGERGALDFGLVMLRLGAAGQ
jgi:DNA-binding transcriptional ArsR family regulator